MATVTVCICPQLHRLTDSLTDGLTLHAYPDFLCTFLILDAVQAAVRQNRERGVPRRLVHFTLDNRRLKCMKDAGCAKIRVSVVMSKKPPKKSAPEKS